MFDAEEIENTPVWMVYNDKDKGPVPVLIGWYNSMSYESSRLMTQREFGTEAEARAWLKEFWQAYWCLSK